MLTKARRWSVSIIVLVIATLATTPSQSVGQTVSVSTLDDNIADAAYCPPTVYVQITSNRTGVLRVYAGLSRRGADAPLGKVWYTFTLPQINNGTYEASGNWWIWGHECRLASYQLLHNLIELASSYRADWTEYDRSFGSYASGCETRDDTYSGEYDPYSDSGESPVNGGPQCGGGGNSGDGSDPGQPPPPPEGGSSCSKEYLVIEVSNDGGITWEVWWQGEGYVCQ